MPHSCNAGVTRWTSGAGGKPFAHQWLRPDQGPLGTELWIGVSEADVSPFAVGDPDAIERDLPVWTAAVCEADAAIAAGRQSYPWAAIVGPLPESPLLRGLASPTTIGGIRLRDGGKRIPSLGVSSPPVLSGSSRSYSWPMIAEGHADGFDSQHAMRVATRQIHDLCTVISLAWRQAVTLRHAPQSVPAGIMSIPDTPELDDLWPPDMIGNRWLETLPEWVDAAWELRATDATYRAALDAWYEGALLEQRRPSMALIAFTAAVEAIGNSRFGVECCRECGQAIGSGRRFRKTLGLVLSRRERETLLAAIEVYGMRSRTAHRGELHGHERTFWSARDAHVHHLGRPTGVLDARRRNAGQYGGTSADRARWRVHTAPSCGAMRRAPGAAISAAAFGCVNHAAGGPRRDGRLAL